jgi:hypothetical protein
MSESALPRAVKSTTGRSIPLGIRAVRSWLALLTVAAPRLAAREATRIFFTPDRRPRTAPGALAGVEPEAFQARSGAHRLACWSYGRGPTVLLVHGWAGSARDWRALAARLIGQGKRVVLFDLPAHGLSSGRTTALPEMARAIHAVAHEAAFTAGGEMETLHAVVAHRWAGRRWRWRCATGCWRGARCWWRPWRAPWRSWRWWPPRCG